ncbi:hypothetical protein BB560_006169 [Smittium megazygosporum]|uniref:Uncharacterized protein n=1 Tax=Smittium megazygosporum TaxID=133381 RepID=A0A2T9YEZ9_9FUNG|nr:hypothetical protein BB560_006169 [Smittium megazygosporum]
MVKAKLNNHGLFPSELILLVGKGEPKESLRNSAQEQNVDENARLEQIANLKASVGEFQFYENLALKQRRNFKDQIAGLSDLCFCVLSKSGDLVQRRYYNYLSENLSHDSLYAINCLKDLLYRSEFQEFEEVNLWSDSGPHFKNSDYLYSACLELPQIFSSKKFKLNYFMENHGKSDVDDLVSAFREKAQVSENISDNNRVYNFQIYRKDAIRGLRIRAKVSSGFRNYLSFYLGDGGLMACPLSLPDPSKYFNIDFRIKVKRDIRTNKYAPDRSNPLGSDTNIMGSTSRNTQRTRMEMLRGIGVSLSI